jgi:D-glycero-D-manno-heptose 1,7-bisphosphate phosphatase
VAEALTALLAGGFVLVVVTNQPDVARGTLRREDVESVNRELTAQLPLDDVRVCYHDDADRCGCRKPEPGLLVDAAADWDIDLGASFMVGDRWRDIDAGKRAGCTTILVDSSYPEDRRSVPDWSAASLHEASKWILARQTLTTS